MNDFVDFFSLSDPNIRYVVLGTAFMAAGSALVGCFTFLKKRALVGDAVAHAVLPGICLSFLVSATKNPLLLVIGAFITGLMAIGAMDAIVKHSKLKEDTATGIVLSVFFGIGIVLLTVIQQSGSASQSGLDTFLFGKAAAMSLTDVWVFGLISLLLVCTILLTYKELMLVVFDKNFANAIGIKTKRFEMLISVITVLAVVVGIQSVGVVLMAAMLITPAAAARFWTDRLPVMLLVASIFGAFAAVGGTYISYLAPAMPTGPWIVMVISIMAISSFFLAPGKGILHRSLKIKRYQQKVLHENVLKLFYKTGEKDADFYRYYSFEQLNKLEEAAALQLKKALPKLTAQGFLEKKKAEYKLTQAGKKKGQRIVKLHRLWEMYLTEYLRLAPDHVHEDAEGIEHIITPEIERKLEEKLNFPTEDPHQSNIPYDHKN